MSSTVVQCEAAAAGEGAGLSLDQDPGAEAVVGPVGPVALDQFVERAGVEGRQGEGRSQRSTSGWVKWAW